VNKYHNDYKNNYFFSGLIVDGEIYSRKPNYSYAYRFMSRLIRIHKEKLNRYFKDKYETNYDLTPAFITQIFLNLCLPRVEFKGVIGRIILRDHLYNSSINKYYKGLRFSWKTYTNSFLHRMVFFLWMIYIRVTKGCGKVFVEADIIDDYRFSSSILRQYLRESENEIIPILNRWSSPYYHALSFKQDIFSLLKMKCDNNLGAHWLWRIAIFLLQPRKIILCDDSGEKTYSLVLAAKSTNIKVIGVSHGHIPPFQAFAYGIGEYGNANLLKFDKFYVWDDIFKKSMLNFGSIYSSDEIYISGWLLDKGYTKKAECSHKKYILYALEHDSVYLDAVVLCLKKFFDDGFIIVIKTRPTVLGAIISLPFEYIEVDDFSREHIECAHCAVGSGSSMIYELSSNNIPVINPYSEFDYNLGMNIDFLLEVDELENGRKITYFKKVLPTSNFLNEFTC